VLLPERDGSQKQPYRGNHISFVTATDAMGKERHYFLGGQDGENEADGNKVDHYEYNVTTDTWIPRQSLPRGRGHSSSSTRPFGCGYLMAGGATNGKRKLSDIGYYHIPTDSWTSIGDLPKALNTPVCDIVTQGDETTSSWLYCATGFIRGKFDYKIQIV
jgi:hypothetical protein